jgi:hypothetical protein
VIDYDALPGQVAPLDLEALPVGAVLDNHLSIENGWSTEPYTFTKLADGRWRRSDGVHYGIDVMQKPPHYDSVV